MEKRMEQLPNHIVIIPDANRRWARERGMNPWEGHEEGAKNIEKLVEYASKREIKCLTFWGSSMDNLMKRPLEEKVALLDIYKRYFQRLLENEDIVKKETQVNVIGRWEEQFPDQLKSLIYQVIDKTKNYQKRMLNFLLAYSGKDEMLQTIKNICEKGVEVTEETVKQNLMTAKIPVVDYLIRTGGEPHLSTGFMMWDISDAQLYFSQEKFPDFNEEKFEEALQEYLKRERRFGQ